MTLAPSLPRVLVSACLLGEPVRHDGRARPASSPVLERWQAQGRVVAVCPERAGGLPVPRAAAEISGAGHGIAVLQGRAAVRTASGTDVTQAYLAGACHALALAQQHRIRVAVLKEHSPSCGSHRVHAGRFDGTLHAGMGVTVALLRQHGLHVFSEDQWDEADRCLDTPISPGA